MEDMPDFLSTDTNLSLEDYFGTSNCANNFGSAESDEPWKELSDGSDSGIDSKLPVEIVTFNSMCCI